MMQTLMIRLGMLAVTTAAVFWIGWTAPAVPDQKTAAASESEPTPSVTHGVSLAGDQAAPRSEPASARAGRAQTRPISGRLDMNRATAEQFESLPGIGPVLARRIVEYRTVHGAFTAVEELKSVNGIGAKKFERVRPQLEITPAARPAARMKGAA